MSVLFELRTFRYQGYHDAHDFADNRSSKDCVDTEGEPSPSHVDLECSKFESYSIQPRVVIEPHMLEIP